jgi:Phosphoesterase family
MLNHDPHQSSSIVDILEPAGVSWKMYAENYTPLSGGGCDTSSSQASGLYRRKHNPFISFTKVTSSATRCAKIVPATQLQTDISSGSLPQFIFYT